MKKMSEHSEQCIIFKWKKFNEARYPSLKFLFSSLNGVRLTIGQAKKAKESGNLSGVPDVLLLHPNDKYHGLAIELKIKGNYASKTQKEFISNLNKNGYYAQVCYGSKEAIETIEKYLKNQL